MDLSLAIPPGGPALGSGQYAELSERIGELEQDMPDRVSKGEIAVSVKDYGAEGDGSTDDTVAIQTALSSAPAGSTVVFPAGTYKVSDTLTVPVGVSLVNLQGSTVKQVGTSKITFDLNGVSNVTIYGGQLVGTGVHIPGSAVSIGICVRGSSSNVRIDGVTMRAHGGVGVKIDTSSTDVRVSGCLIVGVSPPASTGTAGADCGVLVDNSSARVLISNNTISATSQGISTGLTTRDITISDNQIYGITGQHGMYLQTYSRLTVTGNTVSSCSLIGIKWQQNASATQDLRFGVFANNVISGTGSHGIAIVNVDAAYTYGLRDISVTGNNISATTEDALNLDGVGRVLVGNNVIQGITRHGISLKNSSDITISSNRLHTIGQMGVLLQSAGAIARVRILSNTIDNPGNSDIAATDYGIYTLLGTDVDIIDNVVRDSANKMRYGIFFGAGDQASLTVTGNVVTGATDYAGRFLAGVSARAFSGNIFTGTLGSVLNPPPNYVPNVRDYGAKGDGTTDDSAAFAAALAATATAGGTVYVPPGTYMVTNLNVPTNCVLRGTGNGSWLKGSGATATLNLNGVHHVTLEDLRISGAGGHAINAPNVYILNINRCYIQQYTVGSSVINHQGLSGTASFIDVAVTNCVLDTVANNTVAAVYLENSRNGLNSTQWKSLRINGMGVTAAPFFRLRNTGAGNWGHDHLFQGITAEICTGGIIYGTSLMGVTVDTVIPWDVATYTEHTFWFDKEATSNECRSIVVRGCGRRGGAMTAGKSDVYFSLLCQDVEVDNCRPSTGSIVVTLPNLYGVVRLSGESARLERHSQYGASFKTGQPDTANRPAAATAGPGAMVYDVTLGKPIWSNGTVWRDAAGTAV